jgi:membrane fusion protein (multidrug efflux system)
MNRIRQYPLFSTLAILLLVIVGLVVFRLNSGTKSDAKKPRVITVGVATPIRQDLDVRLQYTADIQPNQQVNIFSRVDGYLAKIHVDKGDLVKANQLLVEVDHTDYIHAVNRAKANLSGARADVLRQDANVRNAKLTLSRMQKLIADQFVSQQDLDNAQIGSDIAVAQLESLRAQVQQMEVALKQAETNLSYSYIRAPFDAYVAERNLDAGAYVSNSTASTSTLSRGILNLHQIGTVRILLEVVEKDVPLVKIGQTAEVRAEAYPDRTFLGQVTRVVQALNKNTRTMSVEVDLPNQEHLLKGGMFARVEIVVGAHPQAVQIPLDALTRLENLQYVYVVKEGSAMKVPVEIGVRIGNWIEVTNGLSGEEMLVVSGKDLVSHGTPVQTKPMVLRLPGSSEPAEPLTPSPSPSNPAKS